MTDVLLSVPTYKMAGTCLTEKMRVLDRLPSGPSYSAIGYEFCVND